MYTLYAAVPAFGAQCASPFALKALSLLTLAGVDFTREDVNPITGPRKKLPYLRTPDGQVITDTWNIHRHLEAHAGLELAPFPLDHLVRRTVEEHVYFAQVHFRWTHHGRAVREAFFADVPWPVRGVVYALARRSVRSALWGQGMGRRPDAEILDIVAEDLDAVVAALDGRATFGRGGLSMADICVHAMMDQLVPSIFDDPLIRLVRSYGPLVQHYRHVGSLLAPQTPHLREAQ